MDLNNTQIIDSLATASCWLAEINLDLEPGNWKRVRVSGHRSAVRESVLFEAVHQARAMVLNAEKGFLALLHTTKGQTTIRLYLRDSTGQWWLVESTRPFTLPPRTSAKRVEGILVVGAAQMNLHVKDIAACAIN